MGDLSAISIIRAASWFMKSRVALVVCARTQRYNINMKKSAVLQEKRYSEATGKLHMSCPHNEKTGINVHIVIKEGECYKSGQCMVVECRYNNFQEDVERLISVTW